MMVVCFVVLPCCVVGLIGAAFTALVPVRSVRDRPNNDPISEVTEAVGTAACPCGRAREIWTTFATNWRGALMRMPKTTKESP